MKRVTYASLLALILIFSIKRANAQSSIIGSPIRLGNIEVAQYDFPNRMKWNDANRSCLNLGEGWRLPTKDELQILYNNKNQIGNLHDPYLAYWSSTEIDNSIAWYGVMKDGFTRSTEKFYESGVRAIRTISEKVNNSQEITLDKGDNATYKMNTNSMIIEDIEVQKFDLPNRMSWDEAKSISSSLGHRWRLPNRDELKMLYQNKEKVGGLKINSDQYYWGTNDSYYGSNLYLWAQCMQDGGTINGNANWYLNVRAVRNLIKYDENDAGKEIRKATIPFPRGGKYVGEVKNGMMEGHGIMTYSKDEEYIGEWKDDKRDGKGTMSVLGGWQYDGEWKDDSFNGNGTYTFSKGGQYVGEFKNNNFNGQGTMSYSDGTKYVGEWKEDKRNGQGTMTYSDGGKYIGEWKDDKRNGQGTMTYSDGGKYVGVWNNDVRSGKGTMIYSDGGKYVGEFNDDKQNGQGTFTYKNGGKYVGEFKDDKQNGQGTFSFNNGKIQKGIYENGVYIGEKRVIAVQNNQSNPVVSDYQIRLSTGDLCDNGNAYKNKSVRFSYSYSDAEQLGGQWSLRSQSTEYERINSSVKFGLTYDNDKFYTRIMFADCKIILRIPYSLTVPNVTNSYINVTGTVTGVGNSYVMIQVSQITRAN